MQTPCISIFIYFFYFIAFPVYCHIVFPLRFLILCGCVNPALSLVLLCSLVEGNPEVAVDSIVHLAQNMSPSQRAEVLRILSAVDSPTTAS